MASGRSYHQKLGPLNLSVDLRLDYCCDSIQTCSFVCERFQSHKMTITVNLKESARQTALSKNSLYQVLKLTVALMPEIVYY